jgi:hypothetical protein
LSFHLLLQISLVHDASLRVFGVRVSNRTLWPKLRFCPQENRRLEFLMQDRDG